MEWFRIRNLKMNDFKNYIFFFFLNICNRKKKVIIISVYWENESWGRSIVCRRTGRDRGERSERRQRGGGWTEHSVTEHMENSRGTADLGLAGCKSKVPFSCAHGKNTPLLVSAESVHAGYHCCRVGVRASVAALFLLWSTRDVMKCWLWLYGECGKIETTYRVCVTSSHTKKHLVVVVNMSHLSDLFTYLIIFIRKYCTLHHCFVFNFSIIFHAEIIWQVKQNSIKTCDKIIQSSSYLCDYLKIVFSKICSIPRSVPCNSVFMWGKHLHCRNSLTTSWNREDIFCQYDMYKYGAKTW